MFSKLSKLTIRHLVSIRKRYIWKAGTIMGKKKKVKYLTEFC